LAYASPFPKDNTINNNNNNNFSNGVVEEGKEEISTEIENPGAFAVKPGGYFRPQVRLHFHRWLHKRLYQRHKILLLPLH